MCKLFSLLFSVKPVPTKPQNQNTISLPLLKSSVSTSQLVNRSTTSLKPGQTLTTVGSTTLGIPGTTKSALLERINANTAAQTANQNTLLAGHLTGAIPLKLNSGLVSTTQAQLPATSQTLLVSQSKPGTQPSAPTTVPETQTLYLTQRQQTYSPEEWTMIDVCHFLKYNDCSSYVETFHRNVSEMYSKTCLKRRFKKKTKNWFSRQIIA